MAIKYIIVLFVETPRKFITAVINLRGLSTNKTITYFYCSTFIYLYYRLHLYLYLVLKTKLAFGNDVYNQMNQC
jgi:hypothetical protein